jgi:hypothetical protein
MLGTIKAYIEDLPEDSFDEFYQKYIFEVQDQNIVAEISSIKTTDIMSLDRMIARLRKELYGK